VFDITFLDSDGHLKHVWQSSWGVSTRLIGALVMVHGDDRGLVMPPRVAPVQVVIVPIPSEKDAGSIAAAVASARAALEGAQGDAVRLEVDDRPEYTPGWKFNEWEMRGVPLRLEIGPRDVKAGQVVAVRRDTGEKLRLPARADALSSSVRGLLKDIQRNLLEKARAFQEEHTSEASSVAEVQQVMESKRGFVRAPWCGSAECEAVVKERTAATIRCLPMVEDSSGRLSGKDAGKLVGDHDCVLCGRKARYLAYFARAY
jgi:prolyl-tRNA synthetase